MKPTTTPPASATSSKPPVPSPKAEKKFLDTVSGEMETLGKFESMKRSAVAELVEFYRDRTNKIILLGAAGTVVLAVAGGTALYLQDSERPKKKSAKTSLSHPAPVGKDSEKDVPKMTPEEIMRAHQKILDGLPNQPPKPALPAPTAPKDSKIPQSDRTQASVPDSGRSRKDREEAARNKSATISNPQDVEGILETIREFNKRNAEKTKNAPSER